MSRKGFWIKTSKGVAHVCGDPNMPDKAKEAILAVAEAAMKLPYPPAWSIEFWAGDQWHSLVSGSEKQMRQDILDLPVGEYRLLDPNRAEALRVQIPLKESK